MKKYIFIIGIIICSLFFYISTIGWWGYEKWKYRRSTSGNKTESVNRQVFVRNLKYLSNIELDSFNIYLEKGFRYGYLSSDNTRLINDSSFPFQIVFTENIGVNNINFYIINNKKADSLDDVTIYLRQDKLKDTLLIGIDKYTTKWDSIGYIKVWDDKK